MVRFVKEAYDQIPGTPDARGRRRPPFATQMDDLTVKDQNVHNRCVDCHGERLIRSGEERARSMRLPSQGALVIGNESQISQTRPGATNGGLLMEMLLAELGLARTAIGMDGTLTLIFRKSETSRDIIKYF